MNELEKTLDVAESVSTLLREEHVESAVIGAMALAARGYPRSTEDFDLATCADPFRQLTVVAKRLVSMGYEVELRQPDADDSLGGVIDITGPEFLKVQVVNFLNPFNRRAARLAEEAIHSAEAVPSLRARVVTVPYLVAFKLYAGGRRNEGDVIELLERNPRVTLDEVRKVCEKYGLGQGLEPLLRELSRTLACPCRSRGRAIRFSRGPGSRPAPAPAPALLRVSAVGWVVTSLPSSRPALPPHAARHRPGTPPPRQRHEPSLRSRTALIFLGDDDNPSIIILHP